MQKRIVAVFLGLCLLSSCAIIRQDEVGIKRRLGRISDRIVLPGATAVNPFTQTVLRVPVRTVNLEVRLDLPSKEGLTIRSEISILYRIEPKDAPKILREAGIDYERVVILPVFRSAASDVTARFFAKDMHSSQRAAIEQEIKEQMTRILDGRGFIIENVLMKSVILPERLSQAIEAKLQAEQEAQQMEFILSREKLEAERIKIEAEGVRDAQKIIAEGLSPIIIQFRSIEAFERLSQSPNAKIIITDGKAPFLINP